jgi:hypothetical protein
MKCSSWAHFCLQLELAISTAGLGARASKSYSWTLRNMHAYPDRATENACRIIVLGHKSMTRCGPCVHDRLDTESLMHCAGNVSTCSSDLNTYITSGAPSDYNTAYSSCQTAIGAISPVQALLSGSSSASSAASAVDALNTALAALPSQAVTLLSLSASFSSQALAASGRLCRHRLMEKEPPVFMAPHHTHLDDTEATNTDCSVNAAHHLHAYSGH